MIAGSADFTIGTGPVFLRAAAAGQRLFAIANLIDRPLVELVLRKDVADAAGITEKTPLADRAKVLKGKTIAIQGVGSIVHAWERLVVNRGGLDIEKDVRIAPMDPPGMLAAMETKSIDGFATSLPFTTEAVVKGKAIMLASGARDAPDLLPFAYGLVYTRPDMCTKQREKCVRIANALGGRQQVHPRKAGRGAGASQEAFRQDGSGGAGRGLEDGVAGARQGYPGHGAGPRAFAAGQSRGETARSEGHAEEL